MPLTLRLRRTGDWGYPDGLGEAMSALLTQEGHRITAASEDGATIYLELTTTLGGATWMITDNGGELNVERVNSGEMFSVPLTDTAGLPAAVEDYALVIVVRLLAGLRGLPIDYSWRPPHLEERYRVERRVPRNGAGVSKHWIVPASSVEEAIDKASLSFPEGVRAAERAGLMAYPARGGRGLLPHS